MVAMETICPECGSEKVVGKLGARDAKIVCQDCGNEGTARYEGNG